MKEQSPNTNCASTKRLVALTIERKFDGRITITESGNDLHVNTDWAGRGHTSGNTRFRRFAEANFLLIEYTGGNNFKIKFE